MKIRVKFSKSGVMKFIGHLDIMRYFQKAMRRADIDIAYSEGFNPHQIMSFASPLGVGLTSEGEYMDIEVNSCISSEWAVAQLNKVMAEGMKVKSFRKLPELSKNAMSVVAAADYTVTFRKGYEPCDNWEEGLEHFCQKEQIIVTKKTKKSEREMDIRPFIYELSVENSTIFMKLASGSAVNIKPELVLEAFLQENGYELSEFAFEVSRLELYMNLAEEDTAPEFVSLESIAADF